MLVQVFLLSPRQIPVRVLTLLSLLILGVAIARLETIYLSHHLMQFSMPFFAGLTLHYRLGAGRKNPWKHFNRGVAAICALVAFISAVIAIRYGIWWGLSA